MTSDEAIMLIERCRQVATWAIYDADLLLDLEGRELIAAAVSAALYALKPARARDGE